MKNTALLLLIGICLITFSCKTEQLTMSKNNKTVLYEVSIEQDASRAEWMENLDRKKLVTSLFEKVKSGELQPYDFSAPFPISWEKIEIAMDATNDTVMVMNIETEKYEEIVVKNEMDLQEIKSLVFFEEWSIDKHGRLQKEIIGVAPVRHYVPNYEMHFDPEEQEIRKRVPFVVYYTDKKPSTADGYWE